MDETLTEEDSALANDGSVVQIIMPDMSQTLASGSQLIQVDTEEGQMQYIQVTNEKGENQLIQITPDGQAHIVQLTTGVEETSDETDYLQMTPDEESIIAGSVEHVEEPASFPEPEDSAADTEPEEHKLSILDLGMHQSGLSGTANKAITIKFKSEQYSESEEASTSHAQPGSSSVLIWNQQEAPLDGHDDTTGDAANPQLDLEPVSSMADPRDQGFDHEPMQTEEDSLPQEQALEPGLADSSASTPETSTTATQDGAAEKAVDLGRPILLDSQTVVMIGGKKCILTQDATTGQMVAYPFKPVVTPGKRPRGRPRKYPLADGISTSTSATKAKVKAGGKGDSASGDRSRVRAASGSDSSSDERLEPKPSAAPTEQENSAAEGLLGLSELDGRRKSMRAKKKPRLLADLYETGKIEGVEDDEVDGEERLEDKDFKPSLPPAIPLETPAAGEKRGRGRPSKYPTTSNQLQNYLANLGLPVKRGRGRPRRYPPPGGHGVPMPTLIIPSSGRQTLVLGSMQGTGEGKQGALTLLSPAGPRPSLVMPKPTLSGEPQEQDTTEHLKVVKTEGHEAESALGGGSGGGDGVIMTDVTLDSGEVVRIVCSGDPGGATGALSNKPEVIDDVDESEAGSDVEQDGAARTLEAITKATNSEVTSGAGGDTASTTPPRTFHLETLGDNENIQVSMTPESLAHLGPVLQLPENLVPLLLGNKNTEPVKIGLKASSGDLERLKCPECHFQAYYPHQYQEHIACHTDLVSKCKCCNFHSFKEEDILEHMTNGHPKNVCDICGFMAEHAYVIKRHMMRHDSKGCDCKICGKVYKDQYILKMHVKMVHMPAEVLFECNVCFKKFTRKAHLKRHLRIHEPEKPYKCPHCDYRGCERSDISKHLVIHDEPKHACEECGKSFRHLKNKELHVKRHKGQRDYKCGMCDFYGYTFTDIRKHIDRKHGDAKFVCDMCGCAFRSEGLLREHKGKDCTAFMVLDSDLAQGHGPGVGPQDVNAIRIPTSSQIQEGHIFIDGNQVNITVEQVAPPGEDPGDDVSFTEAQLTEASMADADMIEQQIVGDVGQGDVIATSPDMDSVTLRIGDDDDEDDDVDDDVRDADGDGVIRVQLVSAADVAALSAGGTTVGGHLGDEEGEGEVEEEEEEVGEGEDMMAIAGEPQ